MNCNEIRKFNEEVDYSKKYGVRHVQVLLLFIAMITTSVGRGCLNVAILGMTDPKLHGDEIQTFDWDMTKVGLVLSAYHWGDLVIQIVAGMLVCRYGGQLFLGLALLLTGVFSITTPYSTYLAGWQGACFSRVCLGLAQGFVFPSVHTLLGKWVPISERNRLGIIVYSGVNIATIFGSPLAGHISASTLGWPWVFYSIGGVCILNSIFMFWYGSNSPATHGFITEGERMFIEESLGHEEYKEKRKVPWKCILLSKPVMALFIGQMCSYTAYTIMLMETPLFFKIALGIDIENSGLLSALPYVASFITCIVVGVLADYVYNKGYFSLTSIRKIANTLGCWGPTFALIALMYIPAENMSIAVTFVVMTAALDAISCAGFMLNHIDLSPNFAGVIVSLSLTISDVGNLLGPIVVGYILKDPSDMNQWQTVFLMTAAIYFIGNAVFILFGTAKEQYWNNPKPMEKITLIPTELTEELLLQKSIEITEGRIIV